MGEYDNPAVINYILAQENQPTLIYIGHSMGGAAFFISMIKHPELSSKIEMMVISKKNYYSLKIYLYNQHSLFFLMK